MKSLIKPQKLQEGDTIATITLSNGMAGLFPYRYEIGKKRLEEDFKLRVIEAPNALKSFDWIYNNPKARAEDLMWAFSNPEVKAIFTNIGGEDSIRLLPYIDFEVIKNNPKIFMGYSDTTVSHFMCLKAGLSSFYGPAVITQFAENVQMHQYTVDNIFKILFSNQTINTYSENENGWTNEFLAWENSENQKTQRKMIPTEPWRYISGSGKIQGRLIGGCVEVLPIINNTALWPKLDNWKGCLLFLETSEEGSPPIIVQRLLRNLGTQGILNVINGILFGRPAGDVPPENFRNYDKAILQVLKEFGREDLPVVTNMDFGHTDPIFILPYGCLAEIDVDSKHFLLLESAIKQTH